jgi:hypothetical protein
MVDHVEPRALALCFLNLYLPIHSILRPAVQIGGLRRALRCPCEGLQKVIVDLHFTCQGYEVRFIRLDSPQEIMEYFIVFLQETN